MSSPADRRPWRSVSALPQVRVLVTSRKRGSHKAPTPGSATCRSSPNRPPPPDSSTAPPVQCPPTSTRRTRGGKVAAKCRTARSVPVSGPAPDRHSARPLPAVVPGLDRTRDTAHERDRSDRPFTTWGRRRTGKRLRRADGFAGQAPAGSPSRPARRDRHPAPSASPAPPPPPALQPRPGHAGGPSPGTRRTITGQAPHNKRGVPARPHSCQEAAGRAPVRGPGAPGPQGAGPPSGGGASLGG